jgi:hypothetical protein
MVSLQRIRRSVSKIFILVGFSIVGENQAVDIKSSNNRIKPFHLHATGVGVSSSVDIGTC